jgi:hypothetical protein
MAVAIPLMRPPPEIGTTIASNSTTALPDPSLLSIDAVPPPANDSGACMLSSFVYMCKSGFHSPNCPSTIALASQPFKTKLNALQLKPLMTRHSAKAAHMHSLHSSTVIVALHLDKAPPLEGERSIGMWLRDEHRESGEQHLLGECQSALPLPMTAARAVPIRWCLVQL